MEYFLRTKEGFIKKRRGTDGKQVEGILKIDGVCFEK